MLYKNNGQLDIISAESIGDLTLRGATGYAKAVYTLNKLCKGYINSDFADDARNPGYVKGNRTSETPDTEIVDGSSLPIIDTDEYPLENGVEGSVFPYTDTLYTTELTAISNKRFLQSSDYKWFAGRVCSTVSSYSGFGVVSGDGSDNFGSLILFMPSIGSCSYGLSYGVYPIVSLRSGIKITGGNGTADSPYTISITQNN